MMRMREDKEDNLRRKESKRQLIKEQMRQRLAGSKQLEDHSHSFEQDPTEVRLFLRPKKQMTEHTVQNAGRVLVLDQSFG